MLPIQRHERSNCWPLWWEGKCCDIFCSKVYRRSCGKLCKCCGETSEHCDKMEGCSKYCRNKNCEMPTGCKLILLAVYIAGVVWAVRFQLG